MYENNFTPLITKNGKYALITIVSRKQQGGLESSFIVYNKEDEKWKIYKKGFGWIE